MSDAVAPARPGDGGGFDPGRYLPQGSFGLKLLLVCALALAMAIPAGAVWTLAYSRSNDANMAYMEVAQRRGGAQVMMGPVLVVPFERDVLRDNKVQTVTQRLVLYPETGEVSAAITGERLSIGLHDVPVYMADARFTATFDPSRIAAETPSGGRPRWREARIYMSLSDLRGVREAELSFGGQAMELSPAEPSQTMADGSIAPLTYQRLVGASAPGLEQAAGPVAVTARIRVTGAQRAAFAAFARDTTVRMESDWASPSFDGGLAPDTRSVSDAGFSAEWRIPYLARGSAGAGVDLSFDALVNEAPGATLLDDANPYRSVERALKYSPMFIGLVFLTYFLFETTSRTRAHPAQYVLVGLAQCVFYLLLLSVSEMAGFTLGFVAAAAATVLALSLYAGSVFGSRKAALRALGVFTLLYALIYVLMRMEDYALLAGSIASFIAIAGTMWMTRKLDWYGAARGVRRPLD